MLINQLTNLCLNILCKQAAFVVLLFLFTGCIFKPKIEVDLRKPINDLALTVTINQAITENVGTCSFTASSDPTNMAGFEYRIQFSKAIDPSSLTTADITNSGTGGGTTLTWSLANCGDNTNFKLTASSIVGYGSIIPNLVLNTVQNLVGNNNSASTSTDNSVDFVDLGWVQEAYIKASNSETGDEFGIDVSINGDTLAVGAWYEDSNQTTITNGVSASVDNTNYDSGAVYIYKRTGSTWVQEAYIKAVNSESSDEFGTSVSLSGNTLAVGAEYERSNETSITNGATASVDNSNSGSGAVYVYKRTGSTWGQEAYIKASNSGASDNFGNTISLNGDTLAVGVSREDSNQTTITNGATASSASADNSCVGCGAVYVYKRTASLWAQEAYIKSINGGALGSSVSLSNDSLAVGADGESSNQTTITNGPTASTDRSSGGSGAVFVYKRTGSTWVQEAYIKAINNGGGDQFGTAVSLSGDTLAVSALEEDSNQSTITNGGTASFDDSNSSSGAVYVYKRTSGTWAQEAYIKAVNTGYYDYFGWSVSLSGDTLAVGAIYEASNQTTITNGASASSDDSSTDSGAVYIYKRTGSLWAQDAYVKAANNGDSYYFGGNVSISGDTLVVGSQGEASDQTTITNGVTASTFNTNYDSGAVYVYRNNVRLFSPSDLYTKTTTSSISLAWTSAGLKAVGYKIAYSSGPTAPADCNSGTVVDVGNVLTYNFTSLTAGTFYSFRICSYDSNSNLNDVYTTTSSTTFTTPPNPTSLTVLSQSSTTLILGWTSGGATSSGYKIAYLAGLSAPADCASGTVIDVGNVSSFEVIELSPSSDYSFRVCSYDPFGVGSLGSSTTTGQTIAPVGWEQEAYVKAVNNGLNYFFGFSVSLNGDTLSVGAVNESSAAGAAYVYKRSGRIWAHEAYVTAVNSGTYDFFGYTNSLSGDTLAVGANQEDSNQNTITNGATASISNTKTNSGAVYVYKRTGSNWAQEAYIKADNNGANDYFGYSVSVSGDSLAVGAFQEDSNQNTITNGSTASVNDTNSTSGAVYIYKRTGSNWAQEAYIKANNNGVGDEFGRTVSLSGNSLAVGAHLEDSNQTTITNGASANVNNTSTNSGAVYVYKRNGSTWAQEAYIKADNNGANDEFGNIVSINGDSLAVGVRFEDSNQTTISNGTAASVDNSSIDSGAVYVYKRSGSTWVQEAYIKAINNGADDYFGQSVSINGDTLAVGATQESSNQTTITNGITASIDDTVALSGAVYVYKRTGSTWVQEAYIKADNRGANDSFGVSVSVSGDSLAVGAKSEESNQSTITNGTTASINNGNSGSGAVYIYRNNTRLFEVPEVWATGTSSTITLTWLKSHGSAVGYYYSYQVGATAPATCLAGTSVNAGDVDTDTITGLTAATTYSYRVCANSDGATFTDGVTGTITTLP